MNCSLARKRKQNTVVTRGFHKPRLPPGVRNILLTTEEKMKRRPSPTRSKSRPTVASWFRVERGRKGGGCRGSECRYPPINGTGVLDMIFFLSEVGSTKTLFLHFMGFLPRPPAEKKFFPTFQNPEVEPRFSDVLFRFTDIHKHGCQPWFSFFCRIETTAPTRG